MAERPFMIVPLEAGEALTQKIQSMNLRTFDALAPTAWFVVYDGTTDELSEAIGLGDDQELGTAIVVPATSFSGFAPKRLWEWLFTHGS